MCGKCYFCMYHLYIWPRMLRLSAACDSPSRVKRRWNGIRASLMFVTSPGHAETKRRPLLGLSPFSSTLSVNWITQRMENQQRRRGTWWRHSPQRLTLLSPGLPSLQGSCCHGHCEWKSVKRSGVALQWRHTEHSVVAFFTPYYLVYVIKLLIGFILDIFYSV